MPAQFLVLASSPYRTVDSLDSPNVTLGYALDGNEALLILRMWLNR